MRTTGLYLAALLSLVALLPMLSGSAAAETEPGLSFEAVELQDLKVYFMPSLDGQRITEGVTSTLWNFGDGHGSNYLSPVHQYATTGEYRVTCYILFTNGTGYETTQLVTLKEAAPVVVDEELPPPEASDPFGTNLLYALAAAFVGYALAVSYAHKRRRWGKANRIVVLSIALVTIAAVMVIIGGLSI